MTSLTSSLSSVMLGNCTNNFVCMCMWEKGTSTGLFVFILTIESNLYEEGSVGGTGHHCCLARASHTQKLHPRVRSSLYSANKIRLILSHSPWRRYTKCLYTDSNACSQFPGCCRENCCHQLWVPPLCLGTGERCGLRRIRKQYNGPLHWCIKMQLISRLCLLHLS